MANAALSVVEESFRRFKHSVYASDVYEFSRTDLREVRDAAREIEKQLAAKGENRALRRLEPFLTGLGHYSEAMSVLCNGTPYLPWVWAPIKLFLKIATDDLSAFDKLIRAYAEIAEALPRFDRLGDALKNDPHFQAVLAVFYSDILEFHRRAYKFFRARAWKRFFNTTWGCFDVRFAAIIGSLRHHAELVDKEANAYDVAAAQKWRQSYFEDVHKTEDDRFKDRFEKVLNWLDVKPYIQDDDLDRLSEKCHEGTSQWFLEHEKTKRWIELGGKDSILWVTGIPGSGKSVLCAELARHLQGKAKGTIVFFLCNFRRPDSNTCSQFLKTITNQVIRQNRDFVDLVYDEYVLQGHTSSAKHLKSLIATLLKGLDFVRICVDGLDECEEGEQKGMLSAIRSLFDANSSLETSTKPGDFKATIFSRATETLTKALKKSNTINLGQESHSLQQSIKAFVHSEVVDIREHFDNSYVDDDLLDNVEQRIVASAGGMFLWVQLILDMLRDAHSAHELERVVDHLPIGLDEAYGRIFDRIRQDSPRGSLRKAQVMLAFVAFAQWPLKTFELLDAVAFCTPPYQLKESTKLMEQELERCKPLIEIDDRGRIFFVHFTVKKYILDQLSGPFLQKDQALSDVASACISYMITSLDLVDPQIGEAQRFKSVVGGLHDLHRYASASWLPHLEQISKDDEASHILQNPNIRDRIGQLYRRHDSLRPLVLPPESSSGRSTVRDDCIKSFSGLPELSDLALLVDTDRKKAEAQAHGDAQTTAPDATQNATLFSEALEVYDNVVGQLLASGSESRFSYIPEGYLRRLKSFHDSAGFFCRYFHCAGRGEEFRTAIDRNTHEQVHQPRFFCDELRCPFTNSVGFSNAAALRRHKRSYHGTPLEVPVFNLRHPESPAARTMEPHWRREPVSGKNTQDEEIETDLPNLGALKVNDLVLYRHDDVMVSGVEGILCRVTSIINEGNQTHYSIEEHILSGRARQRWLGVSWLTRIPNNDNGRVDLNEGQEVLALHANTSRFYRALVKHEWKVGGDVQSVAVRFPFDHLLDTALMRRFVLTEYDIDVFRLRRLLPGESMTVGLSTRHVEAEHAHASGDAEDPMQASPNPNFVPTSGSAGPIIPNFDVSQVDSARNISDDHMSPPEITVEYAPPPRAISLQNNSNDPSISTSPSPHTTRSFPGLASGGIRSQSPHTGPGSPITRSDEARTNEEPARRFGGPTRSHIMAGAQKLYDSMSEQSQINQWVSLEIDPLLNEIGDQDGFAQVLGLEDKQKQDQVTSSQRTHLSKDDDLSDEDRIIDCVWQRFRTLSGWQRIFDVRQRMDRISQLVSVLRKAEHGKQDSIQVAGDLEDRILRHSRHKEEYLDTISRATTWEAICMLELVLPAESDGAQNKQIEPKVQRQESVSSEAEQIQNQHVTGTVESDQQSPWLRDDITQDLLSNPLAQIEAEIWQNLREELPSVPAGWQHTFDLKWRVGCIMQLTAQLHLFKVGITKCLSIAKVYEERTFYESANKEEYMEKTKLKIDQIRQHRQQAAQAKVRS